MEKYIKDGKVAVIYSPGYGAGWGSWMDDKQLIFDPIIVQYLLDKAPVKEVLKYCTEKYPDGYFCDIEDLKIKWIPEGTLFRIDEYDGDESVVIYDINEYMVA